MIPTNVPIYARISTIDLRFTETTQANANLFNKKNFCINLPDLNNSMIICHSVASDTQKTPRHVENSMVGIDNSWLGLLCHLDYQKTLDNRINALMYWIYDPIQSGRTVLPRCYTVTDPGSQDAHCVVITANERQDGQYLAIAVMVIHDLTPLYGRIYKTKYPHLDFDPEIPTNRIGRIQVYTKVEKGIRNGFSYLLLTSFLDTISSFVRDGCRNLSYCPTIVDFGWDCNPILMKKPTVPIPVKQSEEDTSCIICMDAQREYCPIPCGHRHYCINCIRELKECATCRLPVQSFIKIFL